MTKSSNCGVLSKTRPDLWNNKWQTEAIALTDDRNQSHCHAREVGTVGAVGMGLTRAKHSKGIEQCHPKGMHGRATYFGS
jgi:hypothetical protein